MVTISENRDDFHENCDDFLKIVTISIEIVTIISCKTVQLTIDNFVTISKILTILWHFFQKKCDILVMILVKWWRFLKNPYNFVTIFRDKFVTILQNRDDFRKSLRFF